MVPSSPPAVSIVSLVRGGVLDAELAALLWLLAAGQVPIHVVAEPAAAADGPAAAIRSLAAEPGLVTSGPGAAIEDVLRQPVPLRPATGVVVVLDAGWVVASHLHRPPLRDGAGHVRPQGPAVLATWDAGAVRWEHFAWGVTPDLAAAIGRRPGDFELEHDRRRDFLAALVAAEAPDDGRVAAAIAAYRPLG